ncbi:hypothetical protein [Chelatococcus reniformis]|uniref:Uncharacterized protein n=1 Tax=Chelatococcus reniformis TaxID=1494448 RepID=A0A916UWK9_9HYPH|nr:hypothetical protein [Chelatococcus reniformis]GGC90804.1 hypothetical protein GCM10010994_55750 [Chelatococcus reniformis]
MSMDYVRKTYSVPAKRGGRVEYTGGPPRLGTITGTRSGRLLIRLDGERHSSPFHPTWELRYLDQGGGQDG